MSAAALREMEQCHEALIQALDGDDIDALEQSIEMLRFAVNAARETGAWTVEGEVRERAQRISALAEAAMMRVNFLTDQARQRLEMISVLRGHPIAAHYGRTGR
jgi:hypothetical protein